MNRNKPPQSFSPAYYKIIIGLLVVIVLVLLFRNNSSPVQPTVTNNTEQKTDDKNRKNDKPTVSSDIDQLTKPAVVVAYFKEHHRLPDYYVTKKQARQQGWNPAQGNLCDVLPGKAIGGDVFTNREGRLPEGSGRKWYEADLNYDCGNRNADRLLFSSDGLVYITTDHYKTFTRQ